MSLSEPLWRVKRTPCPFYAKGNCVFSERCNFIHGLEEVDETTLVEAETSRPKIDEDMVEDPPKTKMPTSRHKGREDSTRMSDLLRELKGVIGEEASAKAEEDFNEQFTSADPKTPPGLEAFAMQTGHPSPAPSRLGPPDDATPAIEEHPAPVHRQDEPVHYASGLLSPVALPDLHLRSFSRDYLDDEQDSEASFATWATPHPLALSPPRSPARTSTFDLLSSPFGSPSSRIMSPNLAAFLNRIHPLSPTPSNNAIDHLHHDSPGLNLNDLDSPESHQYMTETVQPASRLLDDEDEDEAHVFGRVVRDNHAQEVPTALWDSPESLSHATQPITPTAQAVNDDNERIGRANATQAHDNTHWDKRHVNSQHHPPTDDIRTASADFSDEEPSEGAIRGVGDQDDSLVLWDINVLDSPDSHGHATGNAPATSQILNDEDEIRDFDVVGDAQSQEGSTSRWSSNDATPYYPRHVVEPFQLSGDMEDEDEARVFGHIIRDDQAVVATPESRRNTTEMSRDLNDDNDDEERASERAARDAEAGKGPVSQWRFSDTTTGVVQPVYMDVDDMDDEVDVRDEDEEQVFVRVAREADVQEGPTARWDSINQDTALFMGSMTSEEIEAALNRTRPTEYLKSPEQQFDANEIFTSSPTPPPTNIEELEDEEDDAFTEYSPTAQLAYLDDTTAIVAQDDTLYGIYDVYSDMDPDDVANRSDIGSSDSSPPQGFIEPPPLMTPQSTLRRSVVFTPPPRSGVRTSMDSIASRNSNSGTSSPALQPWQSPFTIQMQRPESIRLPLRPPSLHGGSHKSSADDTPLSTPASSNVSQASRPASPAEFPSSSKVPFGFRKSFTLGGTRKSSLLINRSSRILDDDTIPEQAELPAVNASPASASSKAAAKGLKPLRLSTILTPNNISSFISASPSRSSFTPRSGSGNLKHSSLSSTTVSPHTSSNKALLSHLPHISEDHINYNTPHSAALEMSAIDRLSSRSSPTRPPMSAPLDLPTDWKRSPFMSKPTNSPINTATEDYTVLRPPPQESPPTTANLIPPQHPPSAALTTPKPVLMFAIASDDPEQVRQVLASGEAGPNDSVGPQSALAFTLSNDQLSRKLDIVKVLLEYGADTSELQQTLASNGMDPFVDEVDEATKYYLSQAETSLTRRASVLMRRSSFKPLARIRYGIVGQDRALEQLFRVLSMHNQKISTTPIVMLLCGPSGHGKSLLAQKFGSLLDVATHTVNMTTLRSAHDLWQSYSITPDQNGTISRCTLIEFLINNEGKRCVVVLDEIEKTQDDSVLWSLLLPWEMGRCSFEANSMNIDVRNVVWLGTSNIGHDLIFEYHDSLKHPDQIMTRVEYVELMSRLRPRVSDRLGASVLSRVTTILPFVPFTPEEMKALASEALQAISSDIIKDLSKTALNSVIDGALQEFIPSEGARSLYRAVSNLLVDAIDLS